MEEHPLSLYELNALVKRSIHACLPGDYLEQCLPSAEALF